MAVKPPWDPALSDGCSVPASLRRLIPNLAAMCLLCLPECLKHDEGYYNGGTLEDFHRVNQAFYEAILPKIGERWATEWYGAVNTLGCRDGGAVTITAILLLVLLPLIAEARDPQQVTAFRHEHPCPVTGKTTGACPGWVVDHIIPLSVYGADRPDNMQWQTVAAAKVKDKLEYEAYRKRLKADETRCQGTPP